MKKHETKELKGGEGMMGWIQPSCSCGWVGRKEYAYGSAQFTNHYQQVANHSIDEVVKL